MRLYLWQKNLCKRSCELCYLCFCFCISLHKEWHSWSRICVLCAFVIDVVDKTEALHRNVKWEDCETIQEKTKPITNMRAWHTCSLMCFWKSICSWRVCIWFCASTLWSISALSCALAFWRASSSYKTITESTDQSITLFIGYRRVCLGRCGWPYIGHLTFEICDFNFKSPVFSK